MTLLGSPDLCPCGAGPCIEVDGIVWLCPRCAAGNAREYERSGYSVTSRPMGVNAPVSLPPQPPCETGATNLESEITTAAQGPISKPLCEIGSANSSSSDVDAIAGESAPEKVEVRGKDCNAPDLAARAVIYPAPRGASHGASISPPTSVGPAIPVAATLAPAAETSVSPLFSSEVPVGWSPPDRQAVAASTSTADVATVDLPAGVRRDSGNRAPFMCAREIDMNTIASRTFAANEIAPMYSVDPDEISKPVSVRA